jgi:hypothetical protein
MFAKLLCIANWPKGRRKLPEYPITFQVDMDEVEENAGWLNCRTAVHIQTAPDQEPELLASSDGQILKRDVQRLAHDLKSLINQPDTDHVTFVPITPLFEIWVNRLSDDQYRVVIWQDMANLFGGATDIGHQGIRFTSNRARLMGFIRGLESAGA